MSRVRKAPAAAPASTASRVVQCFLACASSSSESSKVAWGKGVEEWGKWEPGQSSWLNSTIGLPPACLCHHLQTCCHPPLDTLGSTAGQASPVRKHQPSLPPTTPFPLPTSWMSRVAPRAASTSWGQGRVSPLNTTFQPPAPPSPAARSSTRP